MPSFTATDLSLSAACDLGGMVCKNANEIKRAILSMIPKFESETNNMISVVMVRVGKVEVLCREDECQHTQPEAHPLQ